MSKSQGTKEPTLCQVTGCKADVSVEKESRFRSRTCSKHSRAAWVWLAGVKQRFCQQCNKFHPLEDFEADKRGCREKLAIHNVRRQQRRKQQSLQRSVAIFLEDPSKCPEELKTSLNAFKAGDLSREELERKMLAHHGVDAGDRVAPARARTGGSPLAGSKRRQRSAKDASDDASSAGDSSSSGPARSQSLRRKESVPDLAERSPSDGAPKEPGRTARRSTLDTDSDFRPGHQARADALEPQPPPPVPTGRRSMLARRSTAESEAATSFFTDSAARIDKKFAQMTDRVPAVRPSKPEVVMNPLVCWEVEALDVPTFEPPSFAPPPFQPPPFQPPPFEPEPQPSSPEALLGQLHHDDPARWSKSPCGMLDSFNSLGPELDHNDIHVCLGPGCFHCMRRKQAAPAQSKPMAPDFRTESMVVTTSAMERLPLPSQHVVRMSMKLPNSTPAHLPTDFHHRVSSAFQTESLSGGSGDLVGYMRPGCLHLTFDMPVEEDAHARSVSESLPSLARQHLMSDDLPWSRDTVSIVTPGQTAVFRCGAVEQSPLNSDSAPCLLLVQPATANNELEITLRKPECCDTEPELLCRMNGFYTDFEILGSRAHEAIDTCVVTIRLSTEEFGVAWLELASGGSGNFNLCEAMPALVTDDTAIVEEICSFVEGDIMPSKGELIALLRDADKVLHWEQTSSEAQDACDRLVPCAAARGWQELLQECIDVASQASGQDCLGRWPDLLVASTMSSSLGTVAQVLSYYFLARLPPPVTVPGPDGLTPLHWAALSGNPALSQVVRNAAEDGSAWFNCCSAPASPWSPAHMAAFPEETLRCLAMASASDHLPEPSDTSSPVPSSPGSSWRCLQQQPRDSFHMWLHQPITVWLMIFSVLVATLAAGGKGIDAKPVVVIAVMGSLAEYIQRLYIPASQASFCAKLSERMSESSDNVRLISLAAGFSDETVNLAFEEYWHSMVGYYDIAVFLLYSFKVSVYLARLEGPLILLSSVLAAFPLSVRLFSRQSANVHEWTNIGIMVYCWSCYFIDAFCVDSYAMDSCCQEDLVRSISSCIYAAVLGVQYAVIYPYHARHRRLVTNMFIGMTFVMLAATLSRSPLPPSECLLYSMSGMLLPAVWSCLGAELGCWVMEAKRLQRFAEMTALKLK